MGHCGATYVDTKGRMPTGQDQQPVGGWNGEPEAPHQCLLEETDAINRAGFTSQRILGTLGAYCRCHVFYRLFKTFKQELEISSIDFTNNL